VHVHRVMLYVLRLSRKGACSSLDADTKNEVVPPRSSGSGGVVSSMMVLSLRHGQYGQLTEAPQRGNLAQDTHGAMSGVCAL